MSERLGARRAVDDRAEDAFSRDTSDARFAFVRGKRDLAFLYGH